MMKEQVYGWYPPAYDVYTDRGPHNEYQKECLYKFRDTMYDTKMALPPSPALVVRGYSPIPLPGSRPSTRKTNSAQSGMHRPKKVPVPKFKLIPRNKIPTPRQCWATKVPETEYTVYPQSGAPSIVWPAPDAGSVAMQALDPNYHAGSVSHTANWQHPSSRLVTSSTDRSSRQTRIQSASIHRERTPVPSRSIKSAGSRQATSRNSSHSHAPGPDHGFARAMTPTQEIMLSAGRGISRVSTPSQELKPGQGESGAASPLQEGMSVRGWKTSWSVTSAQGSTHGYDRGVSRASTPAQEIVFTSGRVSSRVATPSQDIRSISGRAESRAVCSPQEVIPGWRSSKTASPAPEIIHSGSDPEATRVLSFEQEGVRPPSSRVSSKAMSPAHKSAVVSDRVSPKGGSQRVCKSVTSGQVESYQIPKAVTPTPVFRNDASRVSPIESEHGLCTLAAPSTPTPDHLRPMNPVQRDDDEVDDDKDNEPLEWEAAREKYGWLAEVHGNPYGYKKIIKRPLYTVKCTAPDLAIEPPAVHMENQNTFFLNTIPTRHRTYDIHKEWMSETLNTKRLQLQKRIGMNYRWKSFAFVY